MKSSVSSALPIYSGLGLMHSLRDFRQCSYHPVAFLCFPYCSPFLRPDLFDALLNLKCNLCAKLEIKALLRFSKAMASSKVALSLFVELNYRVINSFCVLIL